MGTLVVVRHGQASLFAADYDELSPRGIAQAQFLGAHLRVHGPYPDLVFTGPAKRQRETARLCGEAYTHDARSWPAAQLVPELDEHDAFGLIGHTVARLRTDPQLRDDHELGALAQAASSAIEHGQRSAAFQQLFEAVMRRWLRGELNPDGIESWPSFAARIERGIERLLAHDGPGIRMVAFTSVGPLAVMLQRALGTSDLDSFRTAWRIRNASLTTFVFRGREFTLDGFNALPHLPDPSAWTFR